MIRPLAAEAARGAQTGELNLAFEAAIKVEDLDLRMGVLQISREEAIANGA